MVTWPPLDVATGPEQARSISGRGATWFPPQQPFLLRTSGTSCLFSQKRAAELRTDLEASACSKNPTPGWGEVFALAALSLRNLGRVRCF